MANKKINEYISAAGNWTCPAGITSVLVRLWGGGGAGGGLTTDYTVCRGGGGAGGQYAAKTVNTTPSNTYAIALGAGGTGGTGDGGTGGDSTWATNVVIAKGGQGGKSYENGYGKGVGSSTGGTGDTFYAGGDGSNGGTGTTGGAGGGGAGYTSDGNDASGNTGGIANGHGGAGASGLTSAGNGYTGGYHGGGGSGGANTTTATTTNRNGGAGRIGSCVLTYYDSKGVDSFWSSSTVGSCAIYEGGPTEEYSICFHGDGTTLESIKVYLSKAGSPTGNAYIKIYSHTGSWGSGSPDTLLATSDAISVGSLTTTPTATTATFSGAEKISLANGTEYFLSIYYSGGSGSNTSKKDGKSNLSSEFVN